MNRHVTWLALHAFIVGALFVFFWDSDGWWRFVNLVAASLNSWQAGKEASSIDKLLN